MADHMEEAVSMLARAHEQNFDKRDARAAEEMREIARQNQRCRTIEGLGQLKMEIPSSVAAEWRAKEGKDVLTDPDFIKYQRRKNPEMFARTEKKGNRVGYGD